MGVNVRHAMSADDSPNRRTVLDRATFGNVTGTSASRRSVVGGILATVGSVVGLSGLASATETSPSTEVSRMQERAVTAPYRSSEAVRDALREHEDLLAEVADEGYLDGGSADDLELDDLQAPSAGDTLDGVKFTARRVDGTVTPEIVLVRDYGDEVLNVGIFPERGERFYTVNEVDGPTPDHHYDCPTGTTCCGCCQPDGCHHCCVCC